MASYIASAKFSQANSLTQPVGSPSASRTNWGAGSSGTTWRGVSLSTPISSSIFEFTQLQWSEWSWSRTGRSET